MILFAYKFLTFFLGVVAVLGPIGAVLAMIFAPTVAAPMLSNLTYRFLQCKVCMVVAAFIVASIVSFWIGNRDAYQRGVDDTVAKIARADKKLVDRAKRARSALLKCQEQNMVWDQSTGSCR
ncbi:hypothetical protein [Bradyrhizobium cenepequi]